MRSNRGESLFITDQYARVAKSSSSLDKRVCAFSRREPALTGGADCRYAGHHGNARSHRGEVDGRFRSREPRRGGRIPPARWACWTSRGRGDSFQGIYCGGGVPREERSEEHTSEL